MVGKRVVLAVWLATAVAATGGASEPLHLIHTADVRGTLGICG